jgi:hypothetical protein
VRRLAITVIAASVFTLTSCDGETTENSDYVDQVNEVFNELGASVDSVPTAGGSPAQVSAALKRAAARFGTTATGLDEIHPPPEVASLHDMVVQDFITLRDEASNAANEVAVGGAASAVGVTRQFKIEAQRVGAEIDQTISEIKNELEN